MERSGQQHRDHAKREQRRIELRRAQTETLLGEPRPAGEETHAEHEDCCVTYE